MEELLSKAKINRVKLRSEMLRVAATSLSALSKPCYKPPTKTYYYQFLSIAELTEKDIKEYTKRQWSDRKEAVFQLHMDPLTNFYIFLMQYFLQQRDITGYKASMLFFIIRYYRSLLDKHFIYCDEDTFHYALETLTKTHLFAREKTISNALYFLTNEMIKRYTEDIKSNNLDEISKFIQESRSRLSQSVKSFAETYYAASKEGSKIRVASSPTDDEENAFQFETLSKTERLVDEITRKITVYKYVDQLSKEEAKSITKINILIADSLINSINDVKYTENIRLILKLFIKDLTDVKQICGKDYYIFVRNLMAIKRTSAQIYFKQQIYVLLEKVLQQENLKDTYGKFTSQTQFLVNLFLAYYITMILRKSLC
jgi:DNA-binding transcriptional regulator GbsR (MarR family)